VLKYDAQINKNKILTGYSNPIYLFLISLVKPYQLSNSDQTNELRSCHSANQHN